MRIRPSDCCRERFSERRRVVPERVVEPVGPLLAVDVPGVPDGEVPVINNHIYVLWDGGLLGGYWGCSHVWDDFDERDGEALVVSEPTMTDAEAAERAVAWLAQQLSRPLDVEVWRVGRLVVGRRWVLADSRSVLGARGLRWRSPSSVERLRSAHR